jgi:hypothetical protein
VPRPTVPAQFAAIVKRLDDLEDRLANLNSRMIAAKPKKRPAPKMRPDKKKQKAAAAGAE